MSEEERGKRHGVSLVKLGSPTDNVKALYRLKDAVGRGGAGRDLILAGSRARCQEPSSLGTPPLAGPDSTGRSAAAFQNIRERNCRFLFRSGPLSLYPLPAELMTNLLSKILTVL